MEKTPNAKLQEQVQRVVTPAKKETVQARSWKKETEKTPTWKEVAEKAQVRTGKEPPKRETDVFEVLTEANHREYIPLAHYDARWYRTVWYYEREKAYKPIDPSKGIEWSRPEGWRPETPEETKERLKIRRLQHDQAKVGAVYNYFGKPDQKVRVVQVFENGPPQLNVSLLSWSRKNHFRG